MSRRHRWGAQTSNEHRKKLSLPLFSFYRVCKSFTSRSCHCNIHSRFLNNISLSVLLSQIGINIRGTFDRCCATSPSRPTWNSSLIFEDSCDDHTGSVSLRQLVGTQSWPFTLYEATDHSSRRSSFFVPQKGITVNTTAEPSVSKVHARMCTARQSTSD